MSDFPSEEADLEPKRIQVFGVLHIVFGGLALLNVVGGMVMMPVQMIILQKQIASARTDAERLIYELQHRFYERIASYNWINWVLAAAVGALLLAAGIKLLKRRKVGLKLSNTYVWCAIGASIVGSLLFLLVTKPAVAKIVEELVAEAGATSDMRGLMTAINVGMAAVGILMPVFGMIYPLLTLSMLNKDMVRQHLK